MPRYSTAACIVIVLGLPGVLLAQTTHVSSDAQLRAALGTAVNGDTIVFDNSITLIGDLPNVKNSITIDGGGFALSGNNQFRGLLVASFAPNSAVTQPVSVTIQNLSIQNT